MEKSDSKKFVKKSNENLINLSLKNNKNNEINNYINTNDSKNVQGNLRYMQIDRNYLNSSSDNKGVLKDFIKGDSISQASVSLKASMINHPNNTHLKSKEQSGVNINLDSKAESNTNFDNQKANFAVKNIYISKNENKFNTQNNHNNINLVNNNKYEAINFLIKPQQQLNESKLNKSNIAISVPVTSKQSKNNSKNNSKSTTRVDEKAENKRSKLIESEIKKFQMNLNQLYQENKKKLSFGNSPIHEKNLFKKDLPLKQNNFKINKTSKTSGNSNNLNSINQSLSKNYDAENSHSNIALAKITMENPFKLNLNNLKQKGNAINKNNNQSSLNNSKDFIINNNSNMNNKQQNNLGVGKIKNISKPNQAYNRKLNTEEQSENNTMQENSQISEHSTLRESNYYRKESEKIANMIKECKYFFFHL